MVATWTQRSIGSQVIDSLTVGKLTTGTLQAGTTVNVGDPAGVHTEIGQGAVRIMRPDSDGVVAPAINMGGAERDVVQIVDPDTGSTLAGLGDDGSVVGQSVVADTLTVRGAKIGDPYDPEDLLWTFARGTVGYQMATAGGEIGQTYLGILEASAQVQGGRLYRVEFHGTLNLRNDSSNDLSRSTYVNLCRTLDGSAPTINSPILVNAAHFWPIRANLSETVTVGAYIDVGADPGLWYTMRVLMSAMRNNSGTLRVQYGPSWPAYLTITDCGPQGQSFLGQGQMSGGGGTPAVTTENPAPVPVPAPVKEARDYVKTYDCTWGRTWRASGSLRTDVGADLIQGQAATSGATNNYAMAGFPSQIASDLAGATVSKVELYLYAHHWWGQSGSAVIGTHGQITYPASFSYSGQHIVSGWKRGEGKWVTLPREWYVGFKSGANRGISLGGNTGDSPLFYAKFYGYATPRGPRLRVSYTK